MSLIRKIDVTFKEYTSYHFTDNTNEYSFSGVKEKDPDTNETDPVDIDGKWVYVFRKTKFIPGDGIPVLFNKVHMDPNVSYRLPIYEEDSTSPTWSFFCLSNIELDNERITYYRKQVQYILRAINVPSYVPSEIVVTPRCDRLTFLPLTIDQNNRVSGTRLSTIRKLSDVDWVEGDDGESAVVYLHDYTSALESFADQYHNKKTEYLNYLNQNDSDFPTVEDTEDESNSIRWDVSRGQSIAISRIISSLCESTDTNYKRNIDFESWEPWHNAAVEKHLEKQHPIKAAAEKARFLLSMDAFNRTLYDYTYSQDDTEQDFPEDFLSRIIDKMYDSEEVIDCISKLLLDAHDRAKDCDDQLGSCPKVDDAAYIVSEGNWWTFYIGGWKNLYSNILKPVTASTNKILELISICATLHDQPKMISDYILDHRYRLSDSHVTFKAESQFFFKGKACTTIEQFEEMVKQRYSSRYGKKNIKIDTEGNYFVAKYNTKRVRSSGSLSSTLRTGLDRVLLFGDMVCTIYDFATAKTFSDYFKATMGVAGTLSDIYTTFVKMTNNNFCTFQYIKGFSGVLGVITGLIDYQEKGYQASIFWRQGKYDLAYARTIQQGASLFAIGSSVAAIYTIQASIAAGALASNAVPVAGQVACIILAVIAILIGIGVWIWETWFYRNDLEKWMQNCVPWGKKFTEYLSDKLDWTTFIELMPDFDKHPISLPGNNQNCMANFENAYAAFSDIRFRFIPRANYRAKYDADSSWNRDMKQYTILQTILAFSNDLSGSKDKFELSVEIHNDYNYFSLDIPSELNLLSEKYCNKGIDSETKQILYLINWCDSDIIPSRFSIDRRKNLTNLCKHYCNENYDYFNAIWNYDGLEENKKKDALKNLNTTIKSDLIKTRNLNQALVVLSRARHGGYSIILSGDVYLRIASRLNDTEGPEVNRILDIKIDVDIDYCYEWMTSPKYQIIRDYEQYLDDNYNNGKPHPLDPLPERFLT